MDILFLAVSQLAVSLVIACTILLVCTVLWDNIRAYFEQGNLDIAEIKSPCCGGWQNDTAYFDKIEEFRDGISR